MHAATFADRLIRWHKKFGRKNLPWQRSPDPYPIWVSEIMLQQTQVSTVIDYFERFIKRFADINELADAPIDDVLALWSGLGYYARARNLHKSAGIIAAEYDGNFPKKLEQVIALPGIGRSTAGAILAFSDNQRQPILDGNVKRVLCRYHAIEGFPGLSRVEKKLWQLADQHTPEKNVALYTQAIMDLGATVCTRKNPDCQHCPITKDCLSRQQGLQDKLPNSKAKKSLPTKSIILLMLENNNDEILLHKRPQTGIWGGLWSLPECAIDQDIIAHCKNKLGLEVVRNGSLTTLNHSFSHYHLNIQPERLKVKKALALKEDNLSWFKLEKVHQLGLAKPVKSLLVELESEHE